MNVTYVPCITSIPLDVAAYGKLHIWRQSLMQGCSKAYHRQACWKQLKSGQASREQEKGWRERGNQSPALFQKSIYIFPAI